MKIGTDEDAIDVICFPGNKERPRLYPGIYFRNTNGKWYWLLPRMGISKVVRFEAQRELLNLFLTECSRKGS